MIHLYICNDSYICVLKAQFIYMYSTIHLYVAYYSYIYACVCSYLYAHIHICMVMRFIRYASTVRKITVFKNIWSLILPNLFPYPHKIEKLGIFLDENWRREVGLFDVIRQSSTSSPGLLLSKKKIGKKAIRIFKKDKKPWE